jgi:hypothetical protein
MGKWENSWMFYDFLMETGNLWKRKGNPSNPSVGLSGQAFFYCNERCPLSDFDQSESIANGFSQESGEMDGMIGHSE